MQYRLEKTTRIVRRLDALKRSGDETLAKIAEVISEKATFYDHCRKSWDSPSDKFSTEEIATGKACCDAALDMADAITNELRILFLEEGPSK